MVGFRSLPACVGDREGAPFEADERDGALGPPQAEPAGLREQQAAERRACTHTRTHALTHSLSHTHWRKARRPWLRSAGSTSTHKCELSRKKDASLASHSRRWLSSMLTVHSLAASSANSTRSLA